MNNLERDPIQVAIFLNFNDIDALYLSKEDLKEKIKQEQIANNVRPTEWSHKNEEYYDCILEKVKWHNPNMREQNYTRTTRPPTPIDDLYY